jgi:hypothetical protein
LQYESEWLTASRAELERLLSIFSEAPDPIKHNPTKIWHEAKAHLEKLREALKEVEKDIWVHCAN